MNIAIFTGEISGDLAGGALAREIRKREPEVALWGMGSDSLKEAGVEVLWESTSWGAIGIVEAIRKVPYLLWNVSQNVKRELRERRPDVVVLIDFGAFNVRVAKYAKKLGLKVCYYIPPGSWRRDGMKGAGLAQCTDVVAVPFPWAEDRFRSIGVNAIYVGHPLVERVHASMTRQEFADHFGMDASRPIIGLLPGSRTQEVTHLIPTMLDAARGILREIPEAQFVMSVAPSVSQEMIAGLLHQNTELKDRIADIWHEFTLEAETKVLRPVAQRLTGQKSLTMVTPEGVLVPADQMLQDQKAKEQAHLHQKQPLPPLVLAKGVTYDIMAHCNLLLACSGTATLEATIFETPMIILYRGSKLLAIEYHLRSIKKRVPRIGLPNILSEKTIVPELIQNDANPDTITALAVPLINDMAIRHEMKDALHAVKLHLGTVGASAKTAEIVMELMKQ